VLVIGIIAVFSP